MLVLGLMLILGVLIGVWLASDREFSSFQLRAVERALAAYNTCGIAGRNCGYYPSALEGVLQTHPPQSLVRDCTQHTTGAWANFGNSQGEILFRCSYADHVGEFRIVFDSPADLDNAAMLFAVAGSSGAHEVGSIVARGNSISAP